MVLEFDWFFKEWDRWFSIKASPVTEGGVSVYFRDITKARAREEDLRRANRELEEFAYVASHELQEPLRAVNIYTQLLMRRPTGQDAEARGFGEMIQNAVKRMETLIRDLLTYSRTALRDETHPEPADLSEALNEALEVLQTSIQANGAVIDCEPLPTVLADTNQLAHVFQNLLSNALKYRKPKQTLRIRISAERRDICWVISVKDNGVGFEQQYAQRIFGLFKRLHGGDYPGTGLGLAICQRIIERYGGRIWAESAAGEGAVFSFELPAMGSQ